jgi:hypothetical protein
MLTVVTFVLAWWQNEMHPYLRPGNEQTAEARVQDRQEKATFAKAGVRRRRIHMQPCRTLPRMITPISLLESICWVITDSPSTAQVYINSRARPDNGPVTEEMQDNEHHHSHDQDCSSQDHEHLGGISEEFYAQPLSERYGQNAAVGYVMPTVECQISLWNKG